MAEATLLSRIREMEARLGALEGGYSPAPDLVFNVLAFGADRSGATETRQAFVDACTAIASAGKGKLYVPDGTYLMDCDSYADAINLPSNCWMEMAPGAVLQLAALDAGDDGHAVIRVTYGKTNVRITGGTIIGQRTGPSSGEAGFGILIEKACSNVRVEGVTIRDMWGDGIYIGGTSATLPGPCTDVQVVRCNISNCRRQGITLTNAENVTIEANHITGITGTDPQAGIDIEPNPGQHVNDVRVRSNEITACVGGGVKIQCLAAAEDRWTRAVIVEGNHITCPGTTGISFWGAGCTDCVAEGNYIYSTTYAIYVDNYPVGLTVTGNHIYNPGTGLWLSGPQRSVFAHNNIYSPAANGIRALAEGAQYFQGNTVSGNVIHTPGDYGLELNSVRYCDISHNVIVSSVNHGIYHTGDGMGCNIVGNTLIGCGTAGSKAAIYLNFTDSNQVTDNLIRALGVTANGIVIMSGADDNIVRNNDIYDLDAAAAVVDSGTGTVTTSGNRTA